MGLIKCSECGKRVSEYSDKCPNCGCPMDMIQSNMNDVVALNDLIQKDKQLSNDIGQQRKNVKVGLRIGVFVLLLALITWVVIKCLSPSKIADITIDKITPELAEATRKYDELGWFSEGLARVLKGDKYGYIDKLGHEIIPCKYDDAGGFEYGVAVVSLNDKQGAIDHHGRIRIPIIYDLIYFRDREYADSYFPEDSIAVARKDGKYGMIDVTGKIVVPFEYDECFLFTEGLAAIVKGGKLGYVNKNGDIIIPCIYEYDDSPSTSPVFCQGLAAVRKNGEWGYINKNGNVVIPFQKELLGYPFNKYSLSVMAKNGKLAIIDHTGQRVSQWFNFSRCRLLQWRNGLIEYDDSGVRSRSIYYLGLMRFDGEILLKPNTYCTASLIRGSNGIATVSNYTSTGAFKEGLYSTVTKQLISPLMYDNIRSDFSEGLIGAEKDSKWGFINMQNETIIPFCYDWAYWFSEGFAVVKRFGKEGYVDRYGNDTFSY